MLQNYKGFLLFCWNHYRFLERFSKFKEANVSSVSNFFPC